MPLTIRNLIEVKFRALIDCERRNNITGHVSFRSFSGLTSLPACNLLNGIPYNHFVKQNLIRSVELSKRGTSDIDYEFFLVH